MLFIALIALVAMTMAGIAMMRSVDTANLIAGNFAFKQASLQASDCGVELAFNALPTIVATSLDANISNKYFATRQAVDANGIPTTINWSSVPTNTCGTTTDYKVQYVIDRLCEGPTPVTDLQKNCLSDPPTGGGSKKANTVVFSGVTAVYYRATIRVTGPRGSSSYVQVIISR